MTRFGAVDLGATNLRAAVAEVPTDPLAVERRRTPRSDGEAVARAISETLEAAASAAGWSACDLGAVGVGAIGPLDRDAGAAVRPPNLGGVERVPIRDALVPIIGHPRVFVENDAVAGLVGERAARAEPSDDLVYLTLSTGIGAGVSVDGHVLGSRDGNAAEVGHFVVDPTGQRSCRCGRPGHWEAYCAGWAIPELARDLSTESDPSTDLALDDPGLTAADVFGAAGDGGLADQLIDRVAAYNAIGVADLVHAYDPSRIAVGGAVALENRGRLIEPLAEAAAEHAMLAVPDIAPAVHGGDAVLIGALELAARGGLGD